MNKWQEATESGIKRTKETWFGKINALFRRKQYGDELWDELEELLILADVGVDTTSKLIANVKLQVKNGKITQPEQVKDILKHNMIELLKIKGLDNYNETGMKIVLIIGVNGTGKTTSIAKLAYEATNQGEKVILAAADTFRDAAIEQLKYWGNKLEIDVIAHQHGADPGAVVYDAIQAAHKRQAQVVFIDTAGRLHTKFNLMEELKKIRGVIQKNAPLAYIQTVLVIDATTGQNGLIQAKNFSRSVDVSGVFLTKLDGTAKGGIVFAICNEINLPIQYIGTGENLSDMAPFDSELFVGAIFS